MNLFLYILKEFVFVFVCRMDDVRKDGLGRKFFVNKIFFVYFLVFKYLNLMFLYGFLI